MIPIIRFPECSDTQWAVVGYDSNSGEGTYCIKNTGPHPVLVAYRSYGDTPTTNPISRSSISLSPGESINIYCGNDQAGFLAVQASVNTNSVSCVIASWRCY